jgi:glutamate-1-semialdehyde 2,1-aminomutase
MAGHVEALAGIAELGEQLVAEVEARTPSSAEMFGTAREVLAAGVSANSKTWCHLYATEAVGTRIRDVDGNDYLDLMMGYGPNLLGHAAAPIVEAVRAALEGGTTLVVATPLEVRLAQRIQKLMPGMESMRFVTTGTEATLSAIRVARACTGRNRVAKFEGHYHGQHDNVLMSGSLGGETAGPATAPWPVPDSGGIPPNTGENVLILPWGDAEGCRTLIQQHAADLAAVICEPVPVLNLGAVPPRPEFLQELREMTQEHDVLLIFDETITGFRLALGGATEFFGVQPDLHTLGKAAGGGLPIGVYGGRRDVMDGVVAPKPGQDPRERAYQSGTFSGNRLSMAAGIAMLEELERGDALALADERGEQLRVGLERAVAAAKADAFVSGVGSIASIAFGVRGGETYREFQLRDKQRDRLLSLGLLARGVYWTPGHPAFLASVHTTEDVDQCLKAVAEVTELIVGAG